MRSRVVWTLIGIGWVLVTIDMVAPHLELSEAAVVVFACSLIVNLWGYLSKE